MPYPSLTFANLLQQATRAELEQLISLLQGFLSAQHDETGAHTDITADSITTDTITSAVYAGGQTGTFTPIDSSGAGLSFAAVVGQYLKLGTLVHVSGVALYPATADGSNALIGGLPFSCNTADSGSLAIRFANAGLTYTASIQNSSTTIELYTNAGVRVTNAQLTGSFVAFGGTYLASA